MNNNCTFYVVRHGRTEWNDKKIIQGQAESVLNQLGEEQATELARDLKDIHFDLAFSSDLIRAKRTAEIILLEKNLALETSKLLRERYFGKYQEGPYEGLAAYDALYNALSDKEKFELQHEDIEGDETLTTRFITFIRETAATHPG